MFRLVGIFGGSVWRVETFEGKVYTALIAEVGGNAGIKQPYHLVRTRVRVKLKRI